MRNDVRSLAETLRSAVFGSSTRGSPSLLPLKSEFQSGVRPVIDLVRREIVLYSETGEPIARMMRPMRRICGC
jgi:hypothetical protein